MTEESRAARAMLGYEISDAERDRYAGSLSAEIRLGRLQSVEAEIDRLDAEIDRLDAEIRRVKSDNEHLRREKAIAWGKING